MKITFVKKILADGSPCKKCNEVMSKMEEANQMRFIDAVEIAEEADPNSRGMQLAVEHDVNRAPFFLVEDESGNVEVFTVYFKLVKEVLNKLEENAA